MSIGPVYDNTGRWIPRYDRLASLDRQPGQPDSWVYNETAIYFDTETLGGKNCTGDLEHGIQMALLLEPSMQFDRAYTMKHASKEPILRGGVEGARYLEIALSYGGHTHHREIDLLDLEEPFTRLYLAKEIATGYARLFDAIKPDLKFYQLVLYELTFVKMIHRVLGDRLVNVWRPIVKIDPCLAPLAPRPKVVRHPSGLGAVQVPDTPRKSALKCQPSNSPS